MDPVKKTFLLKKDVFKTSVASGVGTYGGRPFRVWNHSELFYIKSGKLSVIYQIKNNRTARSIHVYGRVASFLVLPNDSNVASMIHHIHTSAFPLF